MSTLLLLAVLMSEPAQVVIAPEAPARCQAARAKARYRVFLRDVSTRKALQTLADATCETFVVEPSVLGSITLNADVDHPGPELKADEFLSTVSRALESQCTSVTRAGDRYRVGSGPLPAGMLKVVDDTHAELSRRALSLGCLARFRLEPLDAWKTGDRVTALKAGRADLLQATNVGSAKGVEALELTLERDGKPIAVSVKLVP